MSNDRLYYLGFSAFAGIGPLRFKLLKDYFGSAQAAWEASEKDMLSTGLGEKLTLQFEKFRQNFSLTQLAGTLTEKKIKYITFIDKEYPDLLKEISSPPIVLYIRGDETLLNNGNPCFGVVGTRKITGYGAAVTKKITSGLTEAGLIIVSGLAYGVDTVAHQTAIAMGGKTIAVLGCGVDVIYPVANARLYHSIVDKYGLVVSEFPPGHLTLKGLFPSRNRIISGLSLGIVVTEGAVDSGALITARYAAEQGREVFAVPGPVTSYLSDGPLGLIKNGAKMVTQVGDILEELKLSLPRRQAGNYPINKLSNQQINEKLNNLSKEEIIILKLLQNESLHFDELVKKTAISAPQLGSILTMMEMKKFIQNTSSIYSLAA